LDLTKPLECIIIQVGEATIVKYANADAIEAEIPSIIGLPPISKIMGPKTATVAALLNKLVKTPVKNTEINQCKTSTFCTTLPKPVIARLATHSAAPVSR